MSIKEKILNRSNSYRYYKQLTKKIINNNSELEKKIDILNDKREDMAIDFDIYMNKTEIDKTLNSENKESSSLDEINNQLNSKTSLNKKYMTILEDKIKVIESYNNKEIPSCLQKLLLGDMEEFFRFNLGNCSADYQKNFLKNIKYISKNIDNTLIKNNTSLSELSKNFIFYLKNDEEITIQNDESDKLVIKTKNVDLKILDEDKIYITALSTDNENLSIKGYYKSFSNQKIDINLIKKTDIEEKKFNCQLNKIKNNNTALDQMNDIYEFDIEILLDKKANTQLFFTVHINNEISITPEIKYENDFINTTECIYPFFISKEDYFMKISRGYKFSLIMAIYNTEKYLPKTLSSIVEQSIGFEENVQLILINDGSKDNSKDICKEFQEKYPKNIIYLEQENSGQATARNNGFKYIQGRYVNFIDSDDYFEKNTLEEVYSFFKVHDEEIDMVGIPIKFFDRKNDYHMLHHKFKETRVIDVIKEPNNPQMQAASTFIKSNLFNKYTFPTNVISSEDCILLNKILMEKKKYGVVNTTHYNYRKRFDKSSTIDSSPKRKEYYTDNLKYYFLELINYSIEKEHIVLPYIQYVLAYDLQWIIKETDLSILNMEEQEVFLRTIKEITSYIDERCIYKNRYVTYQPFICYFMYVKNQSYNYQIEQDNVKIMTGDYTIDSLNNHRIYLDIIEIKENTLYISGFLYSHFDIKNILISGIKEYNGTMEEYPSNYVKYTSRKNKSYLSTEWFFRHSFDLEIPISNNEKTEVKLKTSFYKDGNKKNIEKNNVTSVYLDIGFTKHCKMSGISNYIVKDNYMVLFKDNTFIIDKYSYNKMRKYESEVQNKLMKHEPANYHEAINLRTKYLRLYPLIRLYKKIFKIYIFSDRTTSADDNAEHLFRYANKQKDNVKKYFVVSEESKDFKKLSKVGKTVAYKSKKHKFLYLMADKVISSHPYETQINPFFSYSGKEDERDNYSGLVTSQLYFIQHGVTLANISGWMYKYDKNLSLISTVSDLERDSFYQEGYGYDKSIVQTLGLPRYDNLKSNQNKQILIIPTWRKNINYNEKTFINSEYFEKTNKLLNNEKLIEYAKKYEYTIIFKAHPELEKTIPNSEKRFIDLFKINSYIKLAKDESYQTLLNNSALLITDYSSVFFDFAYEYKPVIYYQPDNDYHYQWGYFNIKEMGFGEVIDNEEELIETIHEYLISDCQIKEKYIERVDKFFKYKDKNNSQRVYDWIKKH